MRLAGIILLLASMLCPPAHAEVVTLKHQGITLNANLERVDGNWPAGPVVLMTHGTLGHRGMEIIASLQDMLAERGISSLAINLGLGVDNRDAAMFDCAAPHTHRHTDAVGEIAAWRGWLDGQGVKKIALLGHSRGGNQTARFAAGNPDPAIVGVFLLAPQTWDADAAASDYRKNYGTDLYPLIERAEKQVAAGKGADLMGPVGFLYCKDAQVSADAFLSYYQPDENMDTPHLLAQITAPVTVFAGSEDHVVAGLAEKVQPQDDGDRVSLVVIDGADHFFRDLYSEEVTDVIAGKLGK